MERASLTAKVTIDLRRKVDRMCSDGSLTISEVVERALTQFFFKPNDKAEAPPRLVTDQAPGTGAQPGLDDTDSTMAHLSEIMWEERLKALEEIDFDALYAEFKQAQEEDEKRDASMLVTMADFQRQMNNLDAAFKATAERMAGLLTLDQRLIATEAAVSRLQDNAQADERTDHRLDAVIDRKFATHEVRLDAVQKQVADIEAWITLEVELAQEQGVPTAPPPGINMQTPAISGGNVIVERYDDTGAPTPEHAAAIDAELEAVGFGPPTEQVRAPVKAKKLAKTHDKTDDAPRGGGFAMRVTWTAKSLKNRAMVKSAAGRLLYRLIDNRDGTWTLQTTSGGESMHTDLPAKEMAKKLSEAEMMLVEVAEA